MPTLGQALRGWPAASSTEAGFQSEAAAFAGRLHGPIQQQVWNGREARWLSICNRNAGVAVDRELHAIPGVAARFLGLVPAQARSALGLVPAVMKVRFNALEG